MVRSKPSSAVILDHELSVRPSVVRNKWNDCSNSKNNSSEIVGSDGNVRAAGFANSTSELTSLSPDATGDSSSRGSSIERSLASSRSARASIRSRLASRNRQPLSQRQARVQAVIAATETKESTDESSALEMDSTVFENQTARLASRNRQPLSQRQGRVEAVIAATETKESTGQSAALEMDSTVFENSPISQDKTSTYLSETKSTASLATTQTTEKINEPKEEEEVATLCTTVEQQQLTEESTERTRTSLTLPSLCQDKSIHTTHSRSRYGRYHISKHPEENSILASMTSASRLDDVQTFTSINSQDGAMFETVLEDDYVSAALDPRTLEVVSRYIEFLHNGGQAMDPQAAQELKQVVSNLDPEELSELQGMIDTKPRDCDQISYDGRQAMDPQAAQGLKQVGSNLDPEELSELQAIIGSKPRDCDPISYDGRHAMDPQAVQELKQVGSNLDPDEHSELQSMIDTRPRDCDPISYATARTPLLPPRENGADRGLVSEPARNTFDEALEEENYNPTANIFLALKGHIEGQKDKFFSPQSSSDEESFMTLKTISEEEAIKPINRRLLQCLAATNNSDKNPDADSVQDIYREMLGLGLVSRGSDCGSIHTEDLSPEVLTLLDEYAETVAMREQESHSIADDRSEAASKSSEDQVQSFVDFLRARKKNKPRMLEPGGVSLFGSLDRQLLEPPSAQELEAARFSSAPPKADPPLASEEERSVVVEEPPKKRLEPEDGLDMDIKHGQHTKGEPARPLPQTVPKTKDFEKTAEFAAVAGSGRADIDSRTNALMAKMPVSSDGGRGDAFYSDDGPSYGTRSHSTSYSTATVHNTRSVEDARDIKQRQKTKGEPARLSLQTVPKTNDFEEAAELAAVVGSGSDDIDARRNALMAKMQMSSDDCGGHEFYSDDGPFYSTSTGSRSYSTFHDTRSVESSLVEEAAESGSYYQLQGSRSQSKGSSKFIPPTPEVLTHLPKNSGRGFHKQTKGPPPTQSISEMKSDEKKDEEEKSDEKKDEEENVHVQQTKTEGDDIANVSSVNSSIDLVLTESNYSPVPIVVEQDSTLENDSLLKSEIFQRFYHKLASRCEVGDEPRKIALAHVLRVTYRFLNKGKPGAKEMDELRDIVANLDVSDAAAERYFEMVDVLWYHDEDEIAQVPSDELLSGTVVGEDRDIGRFLNKLVVANFDAWDLDKPQLPLIKDPEETASVSSGDGPWWDVPAKLGSKSADENNVLQEVIPDETDGVNAVVGGNAVPLVTVPDEQSVEFDDDDIDKALADIAARAQEQEDIRRSNMLPVEREIEDFWKGHSKLRGKRLYPEKDNGPPISNHLSFGSQTYVSRMTFMDNELAEARWINKLNMALWGQNWMTKKKDIHARVDESDPIDCVHAVENLERTVQVWSSRPYREYSSQWRMPFDQRTSHHPGYKNVGSKSLYEHSLVQGKEHRHDARPWEHRLVKQRFLHETSLAYSRNWFGKLKDTNGNPIVAMPVCRPKSMKMPMRAPNWTDEWFRPPRLAPLGTSLSESYDANEYSPAHRFPLTENETASWEDTPECGTLKNVVLKPGDRITRLTPELTSSVRRSRWRKKHFPRGTFPY